MMMLSLNFGVDAKSNPWTMRSLVQKVSDAKSNSWLEERGELERG